MRRVAAILREVTGPRVAVAMVRRAARLRAVGVLLVRLHQAEEFRQEATVRRARHLVAMARRARHPVATVRPGHHPVATVRPGHHPVATVRPGRHPVVTVRRAHHRVAMVRLGHHRVAMVRLGAATVRPVVLRRLVVASRRRRTSPGHRHPVVVGRGSKGVRR